MLRCNYCGCTDANPGKVAEVTTTGSRSGNPRYRRTIKVFTCNECLAAEARKRDEYLETVRRSVEASLLKLKEGLS